MTKEPVEACNVGQVAIAHQRLGQFYDLVQRHPVAGIEQHRSPDALIGRRSGRAARPGRLRPEMHAGPRIVGRQVVVDHDRTPIGHVTRVFDADSEVAQPVGAAVEAEVRLGPLLERQVELFVLLLIIIVKVRRHIVLRRQDRRRDIGLGRLLACLPERNCPDMSLRCRLLVVGIAVIVGKERQRRRFVRRPDQRVAIALESMHLGWRIERRVEVGIVAQRIS